MSLCNYYSRNRVGRVRYLYITIFYSGKVCCLRVCTYLFLIGSVRTLFNYSQASTFLFTPVPLYRVKYFRRDFESLSFIGSGAGSGLTVHTHLSLSKIKITRF